MRVVRLGCVALGYLAVATAPMVAHGQEVSQPMNYPTASSSQPVGQPISQPAAQPIDPYAYERGVLGKFVWNIGGSVVIPVGPMGDRLNTGGGLNVGLTYNFHPLFGAQFEFGSSWAGLKGGSLSSFGVGGHGWMYNFNLNAVVRPFHSGPFGFYLLGGGGLYYRYVEITQFQGNAVVPYCDPWLYYCSATSVGVSSVLGSHSEWDWGADVGGGFTLALSPTTRLYIESRYHYVWGNTYTDRNGQQHSSNGEFVPVTFGVKF
jgi:hypothetical protein